LVASLGEIPDDERQVHFEVPLDPSDAEISAMLDFLAEDSPDAAPAGTLVVAPLSEASITLDVQKPANARSRRPCRANQPGPSADEQKKKKRRLRQVSGLDRGVGPLAPAAEEVPVPDFTDADPKGCAPAAADPNGCDAYVVDENDREEEDEVPLTRKNSRQCVASGESSGVPSPALSALVGLQELSLANFDQTLEDMVPEDLLLEPADDGVMEVCADVLDAGLRSSRASSTLERGPEGQETDLDHLGPMKATEGPLALKVATTENSALKDGVDAYPAPEGVAEGDSAQVESASHCPAPEGIAGDDPAHVGSENYEPAPEGIPARFPSCTSMDVHAGSPPHSGCMVVAQTSNQGVALEGSVPAGQVLSPVDGTELVSAGLLPTALGGDLTPGHQLISHDLGAPSFFSNLQVL
jgi:hypothetical protein